MEHALELARLAEAQGEVPVGAVLVKDQQIIAEGYNQSIGQCDPTAHAEIVALRKGAAALKNYRLVDTSLYVTLEPCAMCVGAMLQARIRHVIFGAFDPRAGAVLSVFQLLSEPTLNHRVMAEGGMMADACGLVLRQFFRKRRR